jgi:hypothetical protein
VQAFAGAGAMEAIPAFGQIGAAYNMAGGYA